MLTTLFKSGNSVAIRIPKALLVGKPGTKVEIIMEGDHIAIYPVKAPLSGVLNIFKQFDPQFMADGRESPDEADRVW